MSQLVIGLGQIGSAVQAVLECDGVDKELSAAKHYDVIHVCIPFNKAFDDHMRDFVLLYSPNLIVIHSTVAPGTSRKYGAVHSPVRGRHPNLAPGVRKFTKFFGGPRAEEAAKLFRDKGVECITTEKSITTELGKLFDTEQYREAIIVQKQIHKLCKEYQADFDIAYTEFNRTYNEGYESLGEPQFKKYILEPMDGPIGGHCVNPNHKILQDHGISIRPYTSEE
jgi:hypothetical protein